MTEPIVAVGTTREPKVRAVRRVLHELRERYPEFLPEGIRLEPRSVASGVPSTPRTRREMMAGARNRAEAVLRVLMEEGTRPVLGIGLEGGVFSEGSYPLLESWTYASDGERGHFGSSGSISLPEVLATDVLEGGYDLGPAADRFFRRKDVAQHEGTFGVLTDRVITREEAFARSILHALAPFYNARAYDPASDGEDRGPSEKGERG